MGISQLSLFTNEEQRVYLYSTNDQPTIPATLTPRAIANSPAPNESVIRKALASKEKLLKLYSMEPLQVNGAFYALPYNLYGNQQDYEWSYLVRWFNKEDPVVLIGDEFWEKIGGPGAYQVIIQVVNEIGKGYKERIYREFLGIEPPSNNEWSNLWSS